MVNRNYIEYGSLTLIIIASAFLRIITVENMGWLADDVFHVRYINEWFLDHFKEYFFQWKHVNFPPMSPTFGNPPIAMWFMTFGMYISKSIGMSILEGARFVNVSFGIFTIILVFIIGKKWFNGFPTAIIASMFLAFSPVVIASDSSAYLDTILSFFIVLDIYILFKYLDAKTKKDKIWFSTLLGISLGLSLLVKLYIIPIIGIIFILFLFRYIINRKDLTNYLIIMVLIFLIPVTLWAGARDINHLQNVFGFISSMNSGNYVGMFGDYIGVAGVGEESILYYFLILWGRLPPILSILFICTVIYGFYKLYLEIRSKNITTYTVRFNFLIISVIISILFVHIFGGMIRTTIHRVIFVVPIMALLSSETLVRFYSLRYQNYIKRNINYVKRDINYTPLIISVIFLLGIPIITWQPKFYNAYNNFLVNGLEGGNELYHVGDGDGLELVGDWVMKNTVPYTTIGVYNFAPALQQYVENRTIIGIPLNKDFEYAISKGAKYLVVHNYIMSGSTRSEHNFSAYDIAFTVYVNNYPYITVYDINPSKRYTLYSGINLKSPNWWLQASNKSSNVSIVYKDEELFLTYNISSRNWVFAHTYLKPLIDDKYTGVYIELYGDGRNENFYLDLPAPNGTGYFRSSIVVDWTGYKELYFPFNQSRNIGNITLSDVRYLKFSIDSIEDKNGILKIRNLSYIKMR